MAKKTVEPEIYEGMILLEAADQKTLDKKLGKLTCNLCLFTKRFLHRVN